MSLINERSDECTTSPLEYFCVKPTQTAIEKSRYVDYQPVSTIREHGSPLEFIVPASIDQFMDLKNSYIHLKLKIVSEGGEDLEMKEKVAPVNDLFNSLWANVEVYMQDQLVSHSNNCHGYMSMMRNLVYGSEEALRSQQTKRLLYKDTAGHMDSLNPHLANIDYRIPNFDIVPGNGGDVAYLQDGTYGNHGLYTRHLYTHSSKTIDLIAPLRFDLAEQERYMLNGIRMRIVMYPQKQKFVLMSGEQNKNYKIIIEKATLTIRKVKPSIGTILGIEEALQTTNALFPVTRTVCKVLSVAKGMRNVLEDNLFQGQLPKRIIIGMVDNRAFAGSYNRNPYNFEHNDMNYINLFIDGTPLLANPLRRGDDTYINCFDSLFQGLNKLDDEVSGSIIKREDWPRGYALIAFDLTADYDHRDRYPIVKRGNIRLEIEYGSQLKATVNVIVYAEFDNIVQVTSDRSIIYDHS